MAATLKDVAREAGVNLSTVSRSLNGEYGVHEDTRKKVMAAAARLEYRPNRVARGLVTGRSQTFGLVVSDIRNPFFADIARGAEDAACRAGWDLLLCNSDLNPDKQMSYVRSLAEKRVDGILMNSVASLNRAQQAELTGLGIPIVLLNRGGNSRAFSTVCADNLRGGALAAEYLTGLGHQRMAHLTGPRHHGNLTERARGFLKYCPAAVTLHGDHSSQGGYEMAGRLFDQHPHVTAVFAANDAIAFGVLRAARERGIPVPDALSVIGFDNVEFATLVSPALTTISQPRYEIGESAIEILIKSARRTGAVPEHRLLGVELVERESCSPRKKK